MTDMKAVDAAAWVRQFQEISHSQRIILAKKVLEDRDIAYDCILHNHLGELSYLFGRLEDLEEEIRGYKNEQK